MSDVLRPGSTQRDWLVSGVTESSGSVGEKERVSAERFQRALVQGDMRSVEASFGRRLVSRATTGEAFSAERTTNLLNYVISNVLPAIDMSDDLKLIAEALLEEEINLQRDLQARIDTTRY